MVLTDFAAHFRTIFPDLGGRRVLVALSGGSDSVGLLHLMIDPKIDLEIEAVHVHHGLRGREADEDAAFCEALCRDLNIPFHALEIQIGNRLDAGREGTWRRLRYDALLDLKDQTRAAAIATGHHRDDVAEGVLVQLLRGGGPRALSGIDEHTQGGVIRPLLPWSRMEIRQWLTERGFEWREDSSNSDLSHLRNRIRHQTLPELEKVSPSLRDHLVNLAGALASSESYLGRKLERQAQWIDPWDPDGGVTTDFVRGLAPPLRSRWLHAQARLVGLERVTRAQLALFEQLISDGEPRAVTLGRRWCIRSARGRLWLEPPHLQPSYSIDLVAGEPLDLPIGGWTVILREHGASGTAVRWSSPAPEASVLTVRSARPDDRLIESGREHGLNKILARSLPRHLRQAWPIICEDDKIYWIPGVWPDPVRLYSGGPALEVMRRERPASNL